MQNLLWYNCKLISNDKNNYFIFYDALSHTSKIHGVLVSHFWDARHERVAQLLQWCITVLLPMQQMQLL